MKEYINPKNIIAFVLAVLIGFAMIFSNAIAEKVRQDTSDFSEGWELKDGTIVDIDDLNTADYDGTIVMTKQLPERVGYDDSLCFIGFNISFTVFVDGHLEYRYDQADNLTGRGYGLAYHAVTLSPDNENATVKIVINAAFENGKSGRIRMMSLENSRDYFARLARGQLLAYSISIGVFIIGVILLFLRLILPHKKEQPSLTALGITAVITGLWLAVDTGFLRLVADLVIPSRIIDYVCMHTWLLPLMAYIYSITKKRRKIFLILAHAIVISDITICLFMRYVLELDLAHLTGYFVTYYLICFGVIVVMLIEDHKYTIAQGIRKDHTIFMTGLSALFFCAVVDIGVYLCGVRNMNGRGTFVRVGFYVFFLTMGIETLRTLSQERAVMKRDKYIDPLTGARNRWALDEFEVFYSDVHPYGYIMSDINGLKAVNDTKGHDEGDELIKDIAISFMEVFGRDHVFRIGGDEFVVYSFADDEDEFKSLVEEAGKNIEKRKRSASIGAVFVTDNSLERSAVRKNAETLMYEEKERYYSISGNDRRRT